MYTYNFEKFCLENDNPDITNTQLLHIAMNYFPQIGKHTIIKFLELNTTRQFENEYFRREGRQSGQQGTKAKARGSI